MKICPKCGRKFERLLAVSRAGNETMVCDDCGMDRQMDIFDFIEKPPQTQFEQLFKKIRDPVIKCANCLCQYCANNAEGDKVKPGEMQDPCFSCDECRVYDGDCRKQNQRKEECTEFVMSDYGARRNRKRIMLIKK